MDIPHIVSWGVFYSLTLPFCVLSYKKVVANVSAKFITVVSCVQQSILLPKHPIIIANSFKSNTCK